MNTNPLYIAVSGQSGTGKSTLIPLVANQLKMVAVLEDTKYLPAYIAWLENRGSLYEAQQQFLQRAFLLQQKASTNGGIQERALYENYEVAVRYYFGKGMLTEHEFDALTSTYKEMCRQVREPDILFHLTASVDVLMKRRMLRGKPHDLSITPPKIKELEKYYDDMLSSWKMCPIYRINTSEQSLDATVFLIVHKVKDLLAQIRQ